MNKSQINFFCERIDVAKHRVMREHRYSYELKYSLEELVGMIINGSARFKSEIIEGDYCPIIPTKPEQALQTFFEFPGEEELKAKEQYRSKIIKRVSDRIDKDFESLKDFFVMKEIDDPREKIKEMQEKCYFTHQEIRDLEKMIQIKQ